MEEVLIITPIEVQARTYENGIGLEQLKEGVGGGWVDLVRLLAPTKANPGIDMYVDDEGLLKGLPFNALATGVAMYFTHQAVTLVGDAVITGCTLDGEAVGLADGDKQMILRFLGLAVGPDGVPA